ncbi:hypothetical protein POM88_020526 [Heracleum sosnowskyi]|uniref:Uncharacterized protein n=1 Tax=Heracleum sosnowskyi TaxID=360622 RepID=A0AAD8IC55_9APIA|nr:hypothetical protein POM88_020526 [Heracleum sosnowskyi]
MIYPFKYLCAYPKVLPRNRIALTRRVIYPSLKLRYTRRNNVVKEVLKANAIYNTRNITPRVYSFNHLPVENNYGLKVLLFQSTNASRVTFDPLKLFGKKGIIKAKHSDSDDKGNDKEFPSWVMAPKEMEYFEEFLKNYKSVKDLNGYLTTFVTVFKFIMFMYELYTRIKSYLSAKKAAVLPSAETPEKLLPTAKTEVEPTIEVVEPKKEVDEPKIDVGEPKKEAAEPRKEAAEPKTSNLGKEKRKTPRKGRTQKGRKTLKETGLNEDDKEDEAKDKKNEIGDNSNAFFDRQVNSFKMQIPYWGLKSGKVCK